VSTAHTYTLKALTDIWTGSVRLEENNGQLRERIVPDRLITTGLLGSIRWWFEVLVRGLGGSACDPSHHKDNTPGPCPQPGRKPHDAGHHCVVCALFGCTGWARKFRFDVLGSDGTTQQDRIKTGQTFQLRFTPLRPIADEERALLDLTVRLIVGYGAIGGKTVYKPTEESSRQSQQHHQDFGLVELISSAPHRQFNEDELRRYVSLPKWRSLDQHDFAWASLQNFWCVHDRHLSRQDTTRSSFNKVLGRKEDKSIKEKKAKKVIRWSDLFQDKDDNEAIWLAGRQQQSKKVFSFKNPQRTFGFVQSTSKLDEMRQRMRDKAWSDLRDEEFLKGGEILAQLLGPGGTA
jgi:CRISPR-associated protein Cmr1